MAAKPYLQLRKAVKRNANFASDDVREAVLHLLDALEQENADIVEEDEEFSHSSSTEKYSEELKDALEIAEREEDEGKETEDDDDDDPFKEAEED
ncbi:MAG: hypothetical protein ACYSW3_30740 [Planctomycetota bacterium]|jgi:hypothetical protein